MMFTCGSLMMFKSDSLVMCSGHRIGTAEVESALVSHPKCAEAAVVGVEHEV
jgi:acetyl-CoA synthetase